VFPFGDRSGRCNYISNGAERDDIVRMFKEQIKRFEELKTGKGEAAMDEELAVGGMEKINLVCQQFAVGRLSREECKRQLIQDCSCDPFGLDDLLDAYDPEKQ
jgi:hypothetical protein